MQKNENGKASARERERWGEKLVCRTRVENKNCNLFASGCCCSSNYNNNNNNVNEQQQQVFFFSPSFHMCIRCEFEYRHKLQSHFLVDFYANAYGHVHINFPVYRWEIRPNRITTTNRAAAYAIHMYTYGVYLPIHLSLFALHIMPPRSRILIARVEKNRRLVGPVG